MVIITQIRERCIGCNYCVELAPAFWRMSKKDGKSVLLGAKDKKGHYTVRTGDIDFEENEAAAKACPVNIIKVSKI